MGACCGRLSSDDDEERSNRGTVPHGQDAARTQNSQVARGEARTLGAGSLPQDAVSPRDAASRAANARAEQNKRTRGKDGTLSGRQLLMQEAAQSRTQQNQEPLIYD